MKKLTGSLLLSLLCVTAVFASGFAFRSKADTGAAPSSVRIYGTVNQTSDGRLSISRQDGDFAGQELIINVSEETRILDAVNGYPVALDTLKNGETIYAYISPAMTLSLPPMSHGEIILCSIPADFKVPEYITVDTLTVAGDGVSGTISADNGTTYTVNPDSQILPYLTRNIVTLQDLVKGKKCLVWTQTGSNTAYKIVAFADSVNTDGSGEAAAPRGWSSQDGSWYYYDSTGSLHKGWLNDNGNWYYLNPETGVMQTGFLTVDGKTYYLQENGKMLTKAKTFTPDASGALH